MNIEIKDAEFLGILKNQSNDIIQKSISQIVNVRNVYQMVDAQINKRLNKTCEQIMSNGSFYDKVAKHLAVVLADRITTDIVSRVDIHEIEKAVAEKIAGRAFTNMTK